MEMNTSLILLYNCRLKSLKNLLSLLLNYFAYLYFLKLLKHFMKRLFTLNKYFKRNKGNIDCDKINRVGQGIEWQVANICSFDNDHSGVLS